MKRVVLILLIALAGVAVVSAQGMWGAPAQAAQPQELVKIEGRINLVQGHPAVISGGKTYYVRIPGMLYGFIEALKEGAAVKLEGYAQAVPLAADSFFFQATKLNVGGKDYDLSLYARGGMMGPGAQGGRPSMPGRGGRGCRGCW